MTQRPLRFEILHRDPSTQGRQGRLTLPHGEVATPAFMPVGTYGAIRSVSPRELEELGADIVLANTYHLVCRPGTELIRDMGGLHRFMAWERPILTDSGGFQVFSLEGLRELDDDGVTFRNPHGGDLVRLTPESVVQAQVNLGVDVAMVLDECPALPAGRDTLRSSLERTMAWAERSLTVRRDPVAGPALLIGEASPRRCAAPHPHPRSAAPRLAPNAGACLLPQHGVALELGEPDPSVAYDIRS